MWDYSSVWARRLSFTQALGLLGWNVQVLADFLRQVVVDFGVPRNRRSLTCGPVNVDRMVGSFAQEFAPVPLAWEWHKANHEQSWHNYKSRRAQLRPSPQPTITKRSP